MRWSPFLHPLFESELHFMLRILHKLATLAKGIWPGPAGAVLHPRRHIQSHERSCCTPPHLGRNAVVIGDRVERRNGGIVPAMVKNQLSPTGLECRKVCVRGI